MIFAISVFEHWDNLVGRVKDGLGGGGEGGGGQEKNVTVNGFGGGGGGRGQALTPLSHTV